MPNPQSLRIWFEEHEATLAASVFAVAILGMAVALAAFGLRAAGVL